MNNEIKEILNDVFDFEYYIQDYNYKYKRISLDDLKQIKDYMINLQEKYDKALNDLVHESHKRIELENKITNLQEENRQTKLLKDRYQLEKENYKLRNDKAIKIFNNETLNKYYYGMSYEFEINDFKEDMLNILKGEDKE